MSTGTTRTSDRLIAVPDVGARRLLAVGAAIVATAVGAYVAFPLPGTPVPVTLQTLAVVAAGALLGPWLGAASMVAYLGLGMAGAPVFAGGGSTLAWLVGPTGGYLVAFPAAAFVAGWAVGGESTSWIRVGAALAAGTAVVFVGGAAQLALLTGMSPQGASTVGIVPFLPGAVLKVAVGVWIVRRFGPASREALGLS